jgi:hypothetical protein
MYVLYKDFALHGAMPQFFSILHFLKNRRAVASEKESFTNQST